jgi:hypothetical protein
LLRCGRSPAAQPWDASLRGRHTDRKVRARRLRPRRQGLQRRLGAARRLPGGKRVPAPAGAPLGRLSDGAHSESRTRGPLLPRARRPAHAVPRPSSRVSLQVLCDRLPAFISANARSLWERARNATDDRIGVVWSGHAAPPEPARRPAVGGHLTARLGAGCSLARCQSQRAPRYARLTPTVLAGRTPLMQMARARSSRSRRSVASTQRCCWSPHRRRAPRRDEVAPTRGTGHR